MIAELLTLAALTLQDPAGDAHGAGDLTPPTAEAYASLAPFDLVEASVLDDESLIVEVRLAARPNVGGLPNGVTLPVIDVYLDLADGGSDALLPGVGMTMPPGRGWEVALRVTGDAAYLRTADAPDAAPAPVRVVPIADGLRLETGVPAPERVLDLQVLTGVYDPFRADAWRPLSAAPSPWAFSSGTPAPPVVDLLATDDAAQRDALRAFALPARRDADGALPWLAAMAVGLAVALVGLILRRRVPVEPGPAGAQTRPDAQVDADDGDDRDVEGRTDRDEDPGPAGEAAGDDDDPGSRRLPTVLADAGGWWFEEPDDDVDEDVDVMGDADDGVELEPEPRPEPESEPTPEPDDGESPSDDAEERRDLDRS